MACGIVVTYHPDADVRGNLIAVVQECGTVVVVDNGSGEHELADLATVPGVALLRLGNNLGIATALNRGIAWARERGFRWCVAFDQDSRPVPGMVAAMWATHERSPDAVIIAPTVREPERQAADYRWLVQHPRAAWLFRRVACKGADLRGVTIAITAGSLFDLEAWERLGGFDEELFIDYVDVDYCLKVLRAGRSIVVSAAAALDHRLGNRWTVRILGREIRPMGHVPVRHYYMMRNRCTMLRRHAWAVPHWAVFDIAFACFNIARVVAFEPERLAKLRMMLRGVWDGARGKGGRFE